MRNELFRSLFLLTWASFMVSAPAEAQDGAVDKQLAERVAQSVAVKKGDGLKKLEATLMELHRQEDEAEKKRDVAALDRLFADDAILVLGKVLTKAEFIGIVGDTKNEPLPASVFNYDEVTVRDHGNTATVSYRVTYQGTNSAGKEETNRFRVLAVWVKSGKQWRMAAAQAQPLP